MAWSVELSEAADRELSKLDAQHGRRALKFLYAEGIGDERRSASVLRTCSETLMRGTVGNQGRYFRRRFATRIRVKMLALAVALVLPVLVTTTVAQAQTYSVLYSFTDGADGAFPIAGLTADTAGNLYGAASGGGIYGEGVIFELESGTNESAIYTFTGGLDGGYPASTPILDGAGNLYGTTYFGGNASCECGVVFRVDPAGIENVLKTFAGGRDGANPNGGLFRDAAGNLYGTTDEGGVFNASCGKAGCGEVFELHSAGNESVVYRFTGGLGGFLPRGLVADASGNLYGGTFRGGTGYGTVFELSPGGQETVLYTFDGGDGWAPSAGVIRDESGNLYGTTEAGGTYGQGVVFKLDSTGQETVLYNFTGGADGTVPEGRLVEDPAGNLYGTTVYGGEGYGVVFKLSPNGKESVLYSFSGGTDGANPLAGLLESDGSLYGTAAYGGNVGGSCQAPIGCGVVFKIRLH